MTVRRASSSPTRHCPASRGAVSAAVNAVSADRSLGRRPLGEPGRTPGRYGGVGDSLPQASADNCHRVASARHLRTRRPAPRVRGRHRARRPVPLRVAFAEPSRERCGRQAAPAQGCPIYPLVKIRSGFRYGTLVSTHSSPAQNPRSGVGHLARRGHEAGRRDAGSPAEATRRRGTMTGPANTAAAWLDQAPPPSPPRSPELPVLRDTGDHSRCLPERTERRLFAWARCREPVTLRSACCRFCCH